MWSVRERTLAGPSGGRPPGTGFGDGVVSGGTVGGVPGNGGSGFVPGGTPGCSGAGGSGLVHIRRYTQQMTDHTTRTNELGQPIGEPMAGWSPPPPPSRQLLSGRRIRIEPLDAERHTAPLWTAYADDVSGAGWTYLSDGPYAAMDDFAGWARRAARSEDPLYFAIVDAGGRALGAAAYLRIAPQAGSIEVGHIHLSPALQGTAGATEAMFLMMRHAFELGYRRYEWKCDALNAPSRAAALRLGFTFEGVFRQALVYKGRSRDTAWYSIIDEEWPRLRAAFEEWLSPANFDAEGRQRTRLSTLTARR